MSVFTKLRRLPAGERTDLVRAFWRLLVVRLLLATVGIKRTQQWLPLDPAVKDDRVADLAAWRRRALAIKRVGARIPGVRCLARSLCLCWWMRREGLAAELRMGIRRDEQGRVSGHAWIEYAGTPVDETAEVVARFQPLRWRDNQAAGLIKR